MIESFQFSDQKQWLAALIRDFHRIIADAVATRHGAHVALSGGSTPKPFYSRLNQEPLPWPKIEWWLGDERWVPPADPASNEKMVRETLGRDQTGFTAHFHSWHLAKEPENAAQAYEMNLQKQVGDPPTFDLILLGLGQDGHTASLFPGTAALQETKLLAMANPVPQSQTIRLTLTFPVLNRARQVWFLVQGKDKGTMVKKLVEQADDIPAARIQNSSQRLYWLQ